MLSSDAGLEGSLRHVQEDGELEAVEWDGMECIDRKIVLSISPRCFTTNMLTKIISDY